MKATGAVSEQPKLYTYSIHLNVGHINPVLQGDYLLLNVLVWNSSFLIIVAVLLL